jgi:hypothetical protein
VNARGEVMVSSWALGADKFTVEWR